MKKNLLLLAAAALAAIAIWFGMSKRDSTISRDELQFAVEDTASISRIFLADRQGHSITLVRSGDDGWMVNDSFPARPDLLKSLLEAISRVQVRTRVSKAGFNNVLKALATDGIKCEIYSGSNDRAAMIYYVGGPTADQLGTFMMKEGAELPFICELPGFNGYLTPRYSTRSSEWREKVVFAFPAASIRNIRVNYPGRPDWSYALERSGSGFTVGDPVTGRSYGLADTTAVNNYLFLFRKVPFETEALKMRPEEKDSLSQQVAIAEMQVIDTAGTIHGLRLYPMPVQPGSIATQDSVGNPLRHDVDRFYANDPDRSAWWVLQHFTFDPLLRKRSDFLLGGKK